jgi:hypothetical protein
MAQTTIAAAQGELEALPPRHKTQKRCSITALATPAFLERKKAAEFLGNAVEVRSGEILGPLYRKMLERHTVSHVYNHWSFMPPLAEQHRRMERFTAPFTVLRLLTPLNISYEEAKKRAEPYTRLWQSCRRCGGML